MKLDKSRISPSGTGVSSTSSASAAAAMSMQQINNLLKSSKNNSPSSQPNDFTSASVVVHRSPSIREVFFRIY